MKSLFSLVVLATGIFLVSLPVHAASSLEDCSTTGACSKGSEECREATEVGLERSGFVCVDPSDGRPTTETYGSTCFADTECKLGQFCNKDISSPDITTGGQGICDVIDPADRPGTPLGGGTDGGGSGVKGFGADNIGFGRNSGYGTDVLQNTNLYKGSPQLLVVNLVRQVFLLIGAVLVVMIIYGGITYLTSAGNDKRIESAKQIITAAVVGTVITFAAFLIAEFVIRALTASA